MESRYPHKMKPLTIWCNADLPDDAAQALREAARDHQLVWSTAATSNLSAGGPDPSMVGCDVAFGQPDPQQVIDLESVKWVHITSAGYTRYDTSAFFGAMQARGGVFTNSSSVYDEPCAQHVLAFMLADARQLPSSFGDTRWPHAQTRPACALLNGQSVVILGYGAIGKRLVEMLAPFGMKISAVRRRVPGDEAVPTYPLSEMDRLLTEADHVVNILPASPSTDGMIGAAQFGQMKPGAVYYNIGRGTTTDQTALIHALQEGHLRAAYLDVTDPEPLPAEHPLWSAPNCHITPHTAGGFAGEHRRLVEHFALNLRRYEQGDALLNRVGG